MFSGFAPTYLESSPFKAFASGSGYLFVSTGSVAFSAFLKP
jgi:hypothetical protein